MTDEEIRKELAIIEEAEKILNTRRQVAMKALAEWQEADEKVRWSDSVLRQVWSEFCVKLKESTHG